MGKHDYKLTVTFDISYGEEFDAWVPYEEALRMVADQFSQDLLDGKLSASKFNSNWDVEYDYQTD